MTLFVIFMSCANKVVHSRRGRIRANTAVVFACFLTKHLASTCSNRYKNTSSTDPAFAGPS